MAGDREPEQGSDDEDIMFLKSIYPALKWLPRARKVALKCKIHQLVFEAEYCKTNEFVYACVNAYVRMCGRAYICLCMSAYI